MHQREIRLMIKRREKMLSAEKFIAAYQKTKEKAKKRHGKGICPFRTC